MYREWRSSDGGAEYSENGRKVAVIGAGPAGLTGAYELGMAGVETEVFEASDCVGGISRTVERDGWRFDIGGHRFFTKVPAVERFWHEILSDDEFLLRPRMSRIYYQGKLYDYPLKALNALRNLGLTEAVRCVLSYAAVRVNPPADQTNFEGWVAARFGWRLYRTFFKTYTEKVWGVDATEIQADWAAQRIKNLSLLSAIGNALLPSRDKTAITSLIEEFQYPKYGPGMMWERTTELVREMGIDVHLRTAITGIELADGLAVAVTTATQGPAGPVDRRVPVTDVISSMPLGQLVHSMSPPAPEHVRTAADNLRYRDFLTVALVVPEEFSFPDNWIYIHDPSVKVGRIQNFGSWSPFLVKDGRTCLGLEYFTNEGDDVWTKADDDLIELAKKELASLGLVPLDRIEIGHVVRERKAYPVYDEHYRDNVDTIRQWLGTAAGNVYPVGRNGMHRYNNADHSMLTAMLTAENIVAGATVHDVWTVNVEQDYHEEVGSSRDTKDARSAAPSRAGSATDLASHRSTTGRDAPIIPRAARPASVRAAG